MSRSFHRVSSRRGITLLELLVTLTIIAMLASIVLFAMTQAQEKARANRTEAIIRRLDSVVSRHWESLQTRRIPLAIPPVIAGLPQQCAAFRLNSMRQMQMYELPDRYSEIQDFPTDPFRQDLCRTTVAYTTLPASYTVVDPPWIVYSTAFHRAYFERVNTNSVVGGGTTPTLDNQSAECLYLIASLQGGAGATLLQQENLPWVDVDRDGMREAADGWGRPITFVRWPAGFVSGPDNVIPGSVMGARQSAPFLATSDHDPFDWNAVDDLAYRLHPLIFSAGRDGQLGIQAISSEFPNWAYRHGAAPINVRTIGGLASCINPYVTVGPDSGVMPSPPGRPAYPVGRMGGPSPLPSTTAPAPNLYSLDWRDNIHNHMQGYR